MDRFDFVFSSYVSHFEKYGSRPDSIARAPWVFAEIWTRQRLVPNPATTILVTGSKGKGTVARQIAWNLQHGHRVGLVISPEELSHYDRIRINNVPIGEAALSRHIQLIQPELLAANETLPSDRYLSPTGIFLTIAFSWFAEQGVDFVVVEGGRGVNYDEIGQLKGGLGIVTSIYDEHLLPLGGTLSKVLHDKLALARCCDKLLISTQVLYACTQLNSLLPKNVIPQNFETSKIGSTGLSNDPPWLGIARKLSQQGLKLVCPNLQFVAYPSPSRLEILVGKTRLICEPVVHQESFDLSFLRSMAESQAAVIMGLPDEKPTTKIVASLLDAGLQNLFAFHLYSPISHIHSTWLQNYRGVVQSLGELDCVTPDSDRCREVLLNFFHTNECVYIVGVQIFIRTVRLALGVPIEGPK